MIKLDERRALLFRWGYGADFLSEMTDAETNMLLQVEQQRRSTAAAIAFSIAARRMAEGLRALVPAFATLNRALDRTRFDGK